MPFSFPPEGGKQAAPEVSSNDAISKFLNDASTIKARSGSPWQNDAAPATGKDDASRGLKAATATEKTQMTGKEPAELPRTIITNASELKAEKPLLKAMDSAKAVDAVKADAADNFKSNAAGYVTDINYPGGKKSRHIERDSKTNEATSVTTKTADTTSTLVNRDGRWLLTMQNMELPVNGKLEVSKNGEVAIKTNGSNVWKVEKTDGTVLEEKENPDGVRIRTDKAGNPVKVARADGSSVEQLNDNTIIDSRPGQKPVTWTKDGDAWKSDAGQTARKNLRINEDGKVSFTDGSGVKHNIDSKNNETREGDGLAKITSDKQNRPAVVDMPDKTRSYEYFDDKSNDVKSVTILNKKTGQSETHGRDNKDSDQWTNTSWRGEIAVGADGVHSVRTHQNGQKVDDNTRWDSYHPDGRVSADLIGKDGSRTSYDRGTNNLLGVRTADGISIDRKDSNGKSTIDYYNPRVGESVKWTKGEDGKYKSDSPLYKDARTDLNFNAKSEMTYTNDKGEKITESKEGNRRVAQTDGTILEYGADNQISKAIRGQIERSFNRANGEIKSVIDRDTKANKESTVFEAKAPGTDSPKFVQLAANGDLSYQTADNGAVIERANGLHLELDKDGDTSAVRNDSSSRNYRYITQGNEKSLVSVIDQTNAERGVQSETFTRVINPDGKLAREFRSDKGNASRYDLTPCADGEYEYRSAGAKQAQIASMPRK